MLFMRWRCALATRVPAIIVVLVRFRQAFVTGGARPLLRSASVKRHECRVHVATGLLRNARLLALDGEIGSQGPLLAGTVGRAWLEDGRPRCSVEIIFANIRFCNSPYNDLNAAFKSLWVARAGAMGVRAGGACGRGGRAGACGR